MPNGKRQLRQTKIQDFCLPSLHEKYIRRLNVAVHDSLRVRRIEPVSDLGANLQEFRYFNGLPANTVLESLALEQLHGDKRTAFELTNIVNCANVRMIEQGCGARFAPESLDRLSVLGNVVGKEFQCNIPAKARVPGFVDHAHASASQFFQDAVMQDGAPDHGGSIRHRPSILRQRPNASNGATLAGMWTLEKDLARKWATYL